MARDKKKIQKSNKKKGPNKGQKKASQKTVKKTVMKVSQKNISKSSQSKSKSEKPIPKSRPTNRVQNHIEVATDPKQVQPVRDNILIHELEMEEKTPGGLYIPQTSMSRPLKGRVLAVGLGGLDKKGRRRPLDVKVGDTVVYSQYVGLQIKIGGSQLLLLKESEILGIAQS